MHNVNSEINDLIIITETPTINTHHIVHYSLAIISLILIISLIVILIVIIKRKNKKYNVISTNAEKENPDALKEDPIESSKSSENTKVDTHNYTFNN